MKFPSVWAPARLYSTVEPLKVVNVPSVALNMEPPSFNVPASENVIDPLGLLFDPETVPLTVNVPVDIVTW